MNPLEIRVRQYDSPCGALLLGSYEDELCLCDWCTEERRRRIDRRMTRTLGAIYRWDEKTELLDETARQLDEYFGIFSPLPEKNSFQTGEEKPPCRRRRFDLPLRLVGTPFQQRVWRALAEVSYGETLSYSTLARRLGYERGIQAVAQAVGANPFSIILPCHRIVGSDGSLTGYAGGLPAKRWLLEWEHECIVK